MSARQKKGTGIENKVFSEKKERSVEGNDLENAIRGATSSTDSRRKPGLLKQQIIPKIPEAVDDFLRNFLLRAGLKRTLKSFEAEWYSSAQKLLAESLRMAATGVFFLPDALTHRKLLQRELEKVFGEKDLLIQEVLVAGESLVRMQRERDFHQLQYQRVTKEKKGLIKDIKQLKKHLESYEPALKQLDDKYQENLMQKMLISLKKDKIQNKAEAKPNQEKYQIKKDRGIKTCCSAEKLRVKRTITRYQEDTDFRIFSRMVNSPQVNSETLKSLTSLSLSCSIRAHRLPITCIDLHPCELILASASDDCSWKLWVLPSEGEKVCELVMTGEGHSEWLSSCSFHPNGMHLATTSGDTTVQLWDLSCGSCVLTLSCHNQPTWDCSFHSCGHFLASCSADRTTKLWDLNNGCCRLTMFRHTASVNSVCFVPFSNLLLTASTDKTLVMWDARLGVCATTLKGHQHPCNHATISLAGNTMASCDSHGIINLWDIRKTVFPIATIDAGPMAANHLAFSPSGKRLAVASSDSLLRVVAVDSCKVSSLSVHRQDLQSVSFDHKGETLVSAGSDGVINVWSLYEFETLFNE